MKIKILLLICFLTSTNLHATTMLPASVFGENPTTSSVVISPNGKHLAKLIRFNKNGIQGTALRLLEIDTNKSSILTSTDNIRFKISSIRWANDKTIIIDTNFPAKSGATSVTRRKLLQIDIATKKTKAVIPDIFWRTRERHIPNNQSLVVDMMENDPNHIMLQLSTELKVGKLGHVVYKFDLNSHKVKVIQKLKKHTYWWKTDLDNVVRLGTQQEGTTNKIWAKSTKDKNFKLLWQYEDQTNDEVSELGFGQNPDILYYYAYEKNRRSVYKADISQRPLKPELVYSLKGQDLAGSLIYSNKNKRPIGIRFHTENGYQFWDEEFKGLQSEINSILPKTRNLIEGMSNDEQRILIQSFSNTDAGTFYVWDRKTNNFQAIARKYAKLNPQEMVDKQFLKINARDNSSLNVKLSQPSNNKGNPSPTIVFPHGSPIKDSSDFDYWAQFFTNRGYNVVKVDLRGSSSNNYTTYVNINDWWSEAQTDIEDTTRWLIKKEIADPEKICLVGAGYGAYAALMEAAKNSDLYQCIVDYAGVTDLPLLIKKSKVFAGGAYYEGVKARIGSDLKAISLRSPVNLAQTIDTPVLIMHSHKDRKVLIEHSRKMYKKLKRAKKEVTFIEQQNGDHYLSNETNRIQLLEEMDKFLASYLN